MAPSPEEHAPIVRTMLLIVESDLIWDSTFQTVFGVYRHEVSAVAAASPHVERASDTVRCAAMREGSAARRGPTLPHAF